MALSIARRMVLYLKRPGGQTQFSTQLRAQMAVEGPLAGLDLGEEPEPPVTSPIRKTGARVGRNDPCPCGSGKKYKRCHLEKDAHKQRIRSDSAKTKH